MTPISCDLCWLRPSIAISKYERPSTGSRVPVGSRSDTPTASGANPARSYSFFGCHGRSPSAICSGYFAGSAAAAKASGASFPASWCWPCPSAGVPLQPFRTTSGR